MDSTGGARFGGMSAGSVHGVACATSCPTCSRLTRDQQDAIRFAVAVAVWRSAVSVDDASAPRRPVIVERVAPSPDQVATVQDRLWHSVRLAPAISTPPTAGVPFTQDIILFAATPFVRPSQWRTLRDAFVARVTTEGGAALCAVVAELPRAFLCHPFHESARTSVVASKFDGPYAEATWMRVEDLIVELCTTSRISSPAAREECFLQAFKGLNAALGSSLAAVCREAVAPQPATTDAAQAIVLCFRRLLCCYCNCMQVASHPGKLAALAPMSSAQDGLGPWGAMLATSHGSHQNTLLTQAVLDLIALANEVHTCLH